MIKLVNQKLKKNLWFFKPKASSEQNWSPKNEGGFSFTYFNVQFKEKFHQFRISSLAQKNVNEAFLTNEKRNFSYFSCFYMTIQTIGNGTLTRAPCRGGTPTPITALSSIVD